MAASFGLTELFSKLVLPARGLPLFKCAQLLGRYLESMITDEEYVKRIRQNILQMKSRVVYATCGVMFGAISLGFLIVLLKFVALFPEPENQKSMVWCALAFGFAFGAISGYYAIMGMRFLLDAILGHRTEKLMLRYHDELAALKNEQTR